MLNKISIKEKEDGGYHVFVNGVDISDKIVSASLEMRAHSLPVLMVEYPICDADAIFLSELETLLNAHT